jgi:cellobiose transport system substrate-binding protein
MKPRKFLRGAATLAAISATAIAIAGCSGGGADPNGNVTITLATFNDFGYSDELLQEYMDANPGVTIVHTRVAESADARTNFFQKLGSTGLADIEAVDGDWLAEAMQYSDLLAEVPDELRGRWLDWKEALATDPDGRLIGYGTDIGPVGICYRGDLFAAAGLPSAPDEVAELFDGDWDNFFDVADRYREATGKPMLDAALGSQGSYVNQIEYSYADADGNVIATENPDVRAMYDMMVDRAVPNSAFASQWNDDWYAAMANGEFAAMLCPPWMLGIISGNAPDVTGWELANAFPNGGGNWGGAYMLIPANGPNVEAAQKFADWLTAPEQQLAAFENVGTFPSQVEALTDPALLEAVNPYYNNAPTGQIYSDRAEAVTVAPFKNEVYFQYNEALQDAIIRVFDGVEDKETSWQSFVSQVEAF